MTAYVELKAQFQKMSKIEIFPKFNTPFFSRWMEFLKIDDDTAKTKKTSFVAENSCKSGRGVLLHSSLF